MGCKHFVNAKLDFSYVWFGLVRYFDDFVTPSDNPKFSCSENHSGFFYSIANINLDQGTIISRAFFSISPLKPCTNIRSCNHKKVNCKKPDIIHSLTKKNIFGDFQLLKDTKYVNRFKYTHLNPDFLYKLE